MLSSAVSKPSRTTQHERPRRNPTVRRESAYRDARRNRNAKPQADNERQSGSRSALKRYPGGQLTDGVEHEHGGKALGDGVGVEAGLPERALDVGVEVVAEVGRGARRGLVVVEPERTARARTARGQVV